MGCEDKEVDGALPRLCLMAGLIVMFSAADSNDSTAGTIMLITLGDS
jgi:hypothetical protein